MYSQIEKGHAKNVANLQKLIEQVTVYANYNPPVENLSVANLQMLYNSALSKVNELEEKRNANKSAIHARQDSFEKLKPTCTRIINLLEILGLPQGTIDQAKSLNKLIQGGSKKSTTVVDEGSEQTKSISTSRQSYTRQSDNFGILLQLLSSIANYNPNEDDLKLVSLNTYKESLMNATQAVVQTEAALNKMFIERDQVLYDDETGLISIAQNVKKYVKSAYGATSPEYITVSKIAFSTLK